MFKGLGVAMITPFDKDLTIDFKSFGDLIDHLVSGSVDYLVPLGSTGEAGMLSAQEQHDVLRFVVDAVKGKLPIVAGNFGHNNTAALINKINDFDLTGIDALLSASPSYVKPTQEGLYKHYSAVAHASPLPIILYNVPGRTSSNMEWRTTIRLAQDHEAVIAIKEASGNLEQITHIINNRPDGFLVISGDDPTAFPSIAIGGEGVISVIGNAFPREFGSMVHYTMKGNISEAYELNRRLYALHDLLYVEGNPTGIKTACSLLDITTDHVRLPLVSLSEAKRTEMAQIINTIQN